MSKIESENQFLMTIKGRNLPICNPRTLLPNINSDSNFEENWLKMLPAESENDAQTDGRTDERTELRTTLQCNFLNGGYNIIPTLFKVAGYKKACKISQQVIRVE